MFAALGSRFALEGEFLSAERYSGGHINDTYFVSYRSKAGIRRYVHQRINTLVFPDPENLSRNITRVTSHIRRKLLAQGVADVDRRVLALVPTRDGDQMAVTDDGEYWRTYQFVEDTIVRMQVRTPADAFGAARGFGEFAALVADLPPAQLHETISGFHDTPARFRRLVEAIDSDPCNRAYNAKREIAQAFEFQTLCRALLELADAHALPLLVTHNDAKITNVLFDERSAEALCIVDLDTVMPGLVLFDVGELLRTAATRSAEDEPDCTKISVDPALFEAVAGGFLSGCGNLCSQAERDAFVTAGKVLAFENGIRFLTDYIVGDRYFRVHRPDHNLERARAQLAIVSSFAAQEEELQLRVLRASQAA